jgi:hypothetical protein
MAVLCRGGQLSLDVQLRLQWLCFDGLSDKLRNRFWVFPCQLGKHAPLKATSRFQVSGTPAADQCKHD